VAKVLPQRLCLPWQQLRVRGLEGQYEPNAAKTRVADLVADLRRDYVINGRNEKEIDQRWMHLAPIFGNDLAASVTMPRLTKYIETRLTEAARVGRKTTTKPATVQRELAMLHRAFNLGFKAGKVFRVPPFPTVTVHNAREVFFERDEFDRLLTELPDDFIRPLAIVACWIGFRRDELLKLEWRQVDFDRKTVRLGVGSTKNKEGRLVVLPDDALAALKSWCERTTAVEHDRGRIIARVFHRGGEPVDFFPYKAWRAACRRAGIPGRRPHDFRRTMARNYRRSGVAEGEIMKIGGWKTRSMFDRYNIINEDDLRSAAARVTFRQNGAGMGQVVAIDSAKKDASA
jgi:integrase